VKSNRLIPVILLLAIPAFVLLITRCVGQDPKPDVTASVLVTVPPESVAEAPPANVAETDEALVSSVPLNGYQPSKLAAVAGFGHNPERDEQQYSAEEMQREVMIADCMQQKGYEYTPTPSLVISDDVSQDPAEVESMLRAAANNPNDRYLRSLSVTERQAYYIALVGVAEPNHPEAQSYDIASQSDACSSKAMREIPGVYARYNALRAEFEDMQKAVSKDSTVVDAVKQWSDCMSLAGFQYAHPSDLMRAEDHALAIADEGQMQLLAKGHQAAANCDIDAALNETYSVTRIKHENLFFERYQTRLTSDTAN